MEEKEFSKAKPISAWGRSVDKTGFAIVGLFLKQITYVIRGRYNYRIKEKSNNLTKRCTTIPFKLKAHTPLL